MNVEIKKDYKNPAPILCLHRGRKLRNLNSNDFNKAYDIKLSMATNEVSELTFKVPFCKERKVDYDSCELLVKFEGEYYIIKSTKVDSENMYTEVTCKHESEAYKGVYCEPIHEIAKTPEQLFNAIMQSTVSNFKNNIKFKGTDVDSNVLRHLITDDEVSVYENFVALAKVFNGVFELTNDENDQRWFYLRTKDVNKGRKFRKELDLNDLNVEYDSSNIFYRVMPLGYTDEFGIQLDVQEAKDNPTKSAIIENYSYAIAKGIPTSVIDIEAQYQQFKKIEDDVYINADDLYLMGKEELAKCCVPTLDASITVKDLSALVDSPLDRLQLMEKIICIDKDINFVFECRIVGMDIDYEDPLQTTLQISNIIRYDTQLQDINHTIDNANSVISTNPWDSDGNLTGDGTAYIPLNKTCDGDHWNTQKILGDLYSKTIFQADQLALRVEQMEKSYAELNMTCNSITSTVEEYGKSISKIAQTSSSIVSTVESLDENIEKSASSIEQYSNKIKHTVTQGNFGSVMEQNPRSFQWTFNQCSRYMYLDDEEGLQLGDRTQDSYSKIGYDGRLEMKIAGEEHPYHCLSQVGTSTYNECGDADEDYVHVDTIRLDSKFDGIPISHMTATCSIAKIYDSSQGEQSLCYWNGCWCKITGSDEGSKSLELYAISTFRRYDVVDGNFEIESATAGMIDISYIVIA